MLRFSRVAVGLAALGLLAAAAPPEVEAVMMADAKPVVVRGDRVGCQLTSGIGRGPTKDDPTHGVSLTFGMLKFDTGWAGTMKASVVEGETATPPTAAYWLDGTATNAEDGAPGIPSSDTQYMLFSFNLGDHTRHAIANLTKTGVIKAVVRGSDGVDQVWTLDISDRPEVLAAWRECLASYPDLPADLAP